jgi:hypothetical protein
MRKVTEAGTEARKWTPEAIAAEEEKYQEYFAGLSEAEQMLHCQAERFSQIMGMRLSNSKTSREDLLKIMLTKECGPKYAKRILADAHCRAIFMVDGPEPKHFERAETVPA